MHQTQRIAITHLSALDNMVREAAGTNAVVLVEGALEELVRVTVRSRVFKAARQKSGLVAFPFTKSRRLFHEKNRVFTIFICLWQAHRSKLAQVRCASKSGLISHIPGSGSSFPILIPMILECKHFAERK